MGRIFELAGERFGRLTVVRWVGGIGSKWECVCDCGKTVLVYSSNLRCGGTRSCGCLSHDKKIERNFKHGFATNGKLAPEYKAWRNMKGRCETPSNSRYAYYGGRGIKICARWRKDFLAFLADMGPCPAGYSIERRDSNKNYSPENCLWIPLARQQANRNSCRYIEYQGRKQNATDWARELGLVPRVVLDRLRSGWSGERALTTPMKKSS